MHRIRSIENNFTILHITSRGIKHNKICICCLTQLIWNTCETYVELLLKVLKNNSQLSHILTFLISHHFHHFHHFHHSSLSSFSSLTLIHRSQTTTAVVLSIVPLLNASSTKYRAICACLLCMLARIFRRSVDRRWLSANACSS